MGAPADGLPIKPSGAVVAEGISEEVLTPEFFEINWERVPLHRRAAEHGRRANRLPEALSTDDLVALIRRAGSSLKVFRHGKPHDMDNFLVAYMDGASLIVNQADRYCPALFDLCQVLAERHFIHVFAVAYLTPPGSQAVRLHNDDQDVLLLQVFGRKQWTVRKAPKLLPYTEEMLGKDSPVPEELIGEVVMEFTMEPHDVLYIPRGFLHEAATGQEPSLHITITVPTSDYCWGVQLARHMGQSLSEGKPSGSVSGRQSNGTSGTSGFGLADLGALDDAALEIWLREGLHSWLAKVGVDGVLDIFDERLANANEGQKRHHSMAMEAKLRPWVSEASRIRLMPGIACHCSPTGDTAVFVRARGNQQMEMPIARSVAELVRSLSGKLQRVADLPCRDAFERICFLQLLLQQGLLQLFLREADERTGGLGRDD